MTDKQIEEQIRALREATKEASQSQETALQFLREAGILDLVREQQEEERQAQLAQKLQEAQSAIISKN